MNFLKLTSTTPLAADRAQSIFCPSAAGLSAPQMDLAFLMPRMNHNQVVRENQCLGDWAALLASDPFGSEAALFDQLLSIGYRGVTNWPSSILLEGVMRQAMSTIPASPEFEYSFLARASKAGLRTMAFFRSLAQARAALEEGIEHLILHPGLLEASNPEADASVQRSLQRLIDTVRNEQSDVRISAYTSAWHERYVRLSDLSVDGLVQFEPQQ